MHIVIADDDPIARTLAAHALAPCGVPLTQVDSGEAVWRAVKNRTVPTVLILDRMMPGFDGVEFCVRARALSAVPPLYILMVTSAGETADVTAGLDAGADDYVVKPFKAAELRARAQVGLRIVTLQESVTRRVEELEQALANVKQLRGLLPMCAYCKKIRVDDKYWQQLEGYLSDHTEAEFSHGICPTCFPAALEGRI
jgi:DNA-binding response OmpR family regulator